MFPVERVALEIIADKRVYETLAFERNDIDVATLLRIFNAGYIEASRHHIDQMPGLLDPTANFRVMLLEEGAPGGD